VSWILALAVLVLVLTGAPLFVVFGGLALWLFAGLPDTPLSGAANDMFSEKFADSPLLVTIPLFTFAGVLLAESGAPARLVTVSKALFGWIPGGLAIVCLITSAIFTTFTGGSGVTIVAIGTLLFPALLREKYSERFSLGLVTTGGSLGVLFPPSVPVIIYGVVAGLDIEGLFTAALVPGLATLVALALYCTLVGATAKVEVSRFDGRTAGRALWAAKWEVALPIVLVGGLASGMLRIHEAAALTALYVLVVELFVYRDVAVADIPRIVRECVVLVGAILIVLATAIGLTAYLIQANVPQRIVESMQTFIGSKWLFLLALNAFLLLVGMTMDIFSAIIVVVPLIAPIADHFGINPYHLAAIFLLNLEIGYLTPPLGLNLFIASFRFERSLPEVCRAVLPFIAILLGTLALVTYVPGLSTWSSRLEAPIRFDQPPPTVLPSAPSAAPPVGSSSSDDPSAPPAPTGETLDDLLGGAEPKPASSGETLEDLLREEPSK
jgi:C4-dicarboxylate transporter, DctM subunit